MAQPIVDALQIKIEKAKANLPEEAQNAIASVDWRAKILELRQRKGYTFEQLGDLELETELVLSGLVPPGDYAKEIGKRMKISGAEANEVANTMNELVFTRIREELIKNIERKKAFRKNSPHPSPLLKGEGGSSPFPFPLRQSSSEASQGKAGDEVEKVNENAPHPIIAQKTSGPVKAPLLKREYTLENISKAGGADAPAADPKESKPKIDPYREIPE